MTTVGIIGAGQLGQMLGLAGRRLGLDFLFLDPAARPPAAAVGRVLQYAFDDREGLARLAEGSDVITYEFENVPVAALAAIKPPKPVFPPALALEKAQDRMAEKTLFQALDIPVPAFRPVDSAADLRKAAEEIGLPLVVKTRRLGYDGKGQYVVRDTADTEVAVRELGGGGLIAEQWVPFEHEVSAIGVRNPGGDVRHYPLTENVHAGGILSQSRAPADSDGLREAATEYVNRLLVQLDYVGVLALELFVVDGGLLANEFAPRVHNSGHWTIEGSRTSQFENHLRAILDMPLGDTDVTGCAGMLNIIGRMPAERTPFETAPWHLHDYGKEPRSGRKLGHATVVTTSAGERDAAMKSMLDRLAAGQLSDHS
jgi:5-(carboxyamino)imidazole ribonucleotide synthase